MEIDAQYGEIEEMNVCDNAGEHMLGNVYVKVSCDAMANSLKLILALIPVKCPLEPIARKTNPFAARQFVSTVNWTWFAST